MNVRFGLLANSAWLCRRYECIIAKSPNDLERKSWRRMHQVDRAASQFSDYRAWFVTHPKSSAFQRNPFFSPGRLLSWLCSQLTHPRSDRSATGKLENLRIGPSIARSLCRVFFIERRDYTFRKAEQLHFSWTLILHSAIGLICGCAEWRNVWMIETFILFQSNVSLDLILICCLGEREVLSFFLFFNFFIFFFL